MAGTMVDVEPAPFKLEGLSHITLPVRSAPEAKRFWVGLFGAEVGLDNPHFVAINIGGTVLDFNEFPPVEPRAFDSAAPPAQRRRRPADRPLPPPLRLAGLTGEAEKPLMVSLSNHRPFDKLRVSGSVFGHAASGEASTARYRPR